MHNFDNLVYRSTIFVLKALKEVNSKIVEELQTSASTISIKNLQMIQLQKAITAVGMFSMLQKGVAGNNGFEEARKALIRNGKIDLNDRFNDFVYAINVLKHGRGRSYEALIAISRSRTLPFKIKIPGESFFDEGNVSEISTLIEVNDEFVLNCAELIEQVSKEARN